MRNGHPIQRPRQIGYGKRQPPHAEMIQLLQGHSCQTYGKQRRRQHGGGAEKFPPAQRIAGGRGWRRRVAPEPGPAAQAANYPRANPHNANGQ